MNEIKSEIINNIINYVCVRHKCIVLKSKYCVY